jgi:hypothetical protein
MLTVLGCVLATGLGLSDWRIIGAVEPSRMRELKIAAWR